MSISYDESQYTDLIRSILADPSSNEDRTGVGTIGTFGSQMKFDLQKGFPLMTHRSISFKIAFEEMMWFLRGETNCKSLQDKNIKIWNGNTSREFLDKMGFTTWPEGELGKGYGFQLRNFGGTDSAAGTDQLSAVIESVRKSPNSRRHLVSYWHPKQVMTEAALPPCHTSWYIQIQGAKLNLGFQMRSNDVICGLPYNLAGYAFLQTALAQLLGYDVGTLLYQGQDVHIYKNHQEFLDEILSRPILAPPSIKINKALNTLDDLLALEYSDIEVCDYKHSGAIKNIPMAI